MKGTVTRAWIAQQYFGGRRQAVDCVCTPSARAATGFPAPVAKGPRKADLYDVGAVKTWINSEAGQRHVKEHQRIQSEIIAAAESAGATETKPISAFSPAFEEAIFHDVKATLKEFRLASRDMARASEVAMGRLAQIKEEFRIHNELMKQLIATWRGTGEQEKLEQ